MWPFKHKKIRTQSRYSGSLCSYCGSTNTKLTGTDNPDYFKIWRGKRAFIYNCLDCGRDFYGEEPQIETVDHVADNDRVIDDEEALREAEEEMKRQIEKDDDRRYW